MDIAARPIADVDVTEVDGSFFLLHPLDARVMVLNESAYAIWEMWHEARDLQALVREVAALFGKVAADVESDVRAALEDFAAHGFLQP